MMKQTSIPVESYQTTTSSDEVKIIADEPCLAEVYTPDFSGHLNLISKTPENHNEFDELLKEWEQNDPDALKKSRAWVADSFYSEDGDTVKTLRLRNGLSQKQLADILETKQSYISRIECGTVDLMFSTMHKLCNALDVDMNILARAIERQEEINQKKHNERN